MRHVAVAAEHLVAALADQHDDDAVLARLPAEEVHRQAGRIADRLVLLVDQLGQVVAALVGGDADLVVVAAERLATWRAYGRSWKFSAGAEALEADREGLQRASMSRLISATLALESTPPDRKAPTGTSAIRRFLHRLDSSSRTRADRLRLVDPWRARASSGTADQ